MSKNFQYLYWFVDVLISNQLPLRNIFYKYEVIVEDIGVEPMTLCVQGRCSSQLS